MAQADHHGKRWSRTAHEGEKLLNWRYVKRLDPKDIPSRYTHPTSTSSNYRYSVMNEYGQIALAVNVESCSYADGILLKAHRRLRVSLEQWKHGRRRKYDRPSAAGESAADDVEMESEAANAQ